MVRYTRYLDKLLIFKGFFVSEMGGGLDTIDSPP